MAVTSSNNGTTPESSLALPLQDRVAIVTGSSRGIGKAIAIHLASLGAKLVINYVSNKEQAHIVADEINSSWKASDNNLRAIVVHADVSEPAHVKLLFEEAERVFGSEVHVLVHNAAILDTTYPTIAETPVENFDRIFSVNCRGTFLCCKEAANRLKRGCSGRIILISSSGVALSLPRAAPYLSTKAAMEVMSKILAKELGGTGITVNCVAPGPVMTDMMFSTGTTDEKVIQKMVEDCPHGRIGETSDVAPFVGFLASDPSEWINGQVIRVNGGWV